MVWVSTLCFLAKVARAELNERVKPNYRVRRLVLVLIVAIVSLSTLAYDMALTEFSQKPKTSTGKVAPGDQTAAAVLETLAVKGKAPKTGYTRTQFSNGWQRQGECDMRNIILRRDLVEVKVDDMCKVLSGVLSDPYTGTRIDFVRGPGTSDKVQIDHVVALSNAWQTGAQQLSSLERQSLANDPLNLIAVDGSANQKKSDSDAASWLPPNKAFRCQYIARQIAVKQLYRLWVTSAEKVAMQHVLATCPTQPMPTQ